MNKTKMPVFKASPLWNSCESYSLRHHLWAEEYPRFYLSSVKLCAVENKGAYVRLFSEEAAPRAVYTGRDDPIYKDSCMEVFIKPFDDDARYINFEINPNGACLCELGSCRHDRVLVKSVTDISFEIAVLPEQCGWSVELFIPDELIAACFGRKFSFALHNELKMNVYKCGDETPFPHYSSLFFVGTSQPDFHTPEFFGTVKMIDERNIEQ